MSVTNAKPTRIHVVIVGYVQGVGFRYAAQRQAQSLGLHGWVRNTPNGSVEAVVEGNSEAVRSFESWAQSGPSQASVESVETYSEIPRGETGFRILP
jgi:acylphosphatase